MPALARPYRHALSVAAGPPEEMRWGDLYDGLMRARTSALAASLRVLRLRDATLGPRSWGALTRWSVGELRTLDLSGNAGSARSVAALVRSEAASKLGVLLIGGNAHDDDALAAYGEVNWPHLEVLGLDRLTMREGGRAQQRALRGDRLASFLDRARMPALSKLSLRDNLLDDRDCDCLVASGWTSTLTHLDLAHNRIGIDSAARLVRASFPSLRWLNLGGNRMDAQQRKELVLLAEPLGVRVEFVAAWSLERSRQA